MTTEKNYLNFHVLISHSPSCLNRDDQNMQKRAVFGGVERIRISSQCLKREMRKPRENAFNYWSTTLGNPSIRTRSNIRVTDLLINELKEEFPREVVERASQLFLKTVSKDDETEADEKEYEDEKETENESTKKIAVAPWVIDEIKEICRVVATTKLSDEELKKANEKFRKQKGKKTKPESFFIESALISKIRSELDKKKENLFKAIGSAVDVALWGRMATSGLMTPVDGSLAVAHAITTHEAQADTDWFTAVDDLIQESGEVGAGHLDTQEFSSGVFYRYASLNISKLQKNLGGATRERALEIAKHVFHMLATVVPSAKQQSFAAHNPADFAIVSFADQPISMANAFEQPIERDKEGGYYKPSVEKLMSYWKESNDFYNLDENAACCIKNKTIPIVEGLLKKNSLGDVEKWIVNDGKDS